MTALPDRSGHGANEVSVERLEFVAALLTSARDLDELVTHIHTIVEQTVAADQTGFYLYDEDSARLRLLIAKGLDEDERRSAEATAMERHPGEVFVTRRPLFIEDTSEAPAASSTDGGRRLEPRSRVYLPVMCHERCVGTFGLASVRPNAFTQAHITLLSFMCNIAGVVYGQLMASKRERTLETRLLQAQKREALGTLAGSVAHDFNNLLTIIVGHAELLSLDLEGDEQRAELASILDAANRAGALAGRLRAFSRQDAPAPSPHDLRELTSGLSSMLGTALGAEWDLDIEAGEDPMITEIDENEFGQAMLNIILNGRDAMPAGGKITVSFSRAHLEAADDGTAPAGEHVQVSIRDTGTGMDSATQARIFEPFFTTKDRDTGTGIGLPTVMSIVQRHGGRIHVESAPGEGTCFQLSFPLSQRARPQTQAADPRREAVDARGVRVLVAEDDPYLRMLLVRVIRGAGFEVEEAADGAAALVLIRAAITPFDLLVTDLRMPVMDGKQLLEAVERESASTSALVISGYSSDLKLQSELRKDQRYPLLWKPFTPTQLLEAITKLAVEHRRVRSAQSRRGGGRAARGEG